VDHSLIDDMADRNSRLLSQVVRRGYDNSFRYISHLKLEVLSKPLSDFYATALKYLFLKSLSPDLKLIVANRQTCELIAADVVSRSDALYSYRGTARCDLSALDDSTTLIYDLSFD